MGIDLSFLGDFWSEIFYLFNFSAPIFGFSIFSAPIDFWIVVFFLVLPFD